MLLAALLISAVLMPAQAQAFKPKIIYVVATEESEGIVFTAKVRMDKGGRNQREVFVAYDGERKEARALERPPLSHYETPPYSAPVWDCYRLQVVAKNRFGTTRKTMRASLLGTNGCN